MKGLLLAMLCAAPLVAGYGDVEVPEAQAAPAVEPAAYCYSMGCDGVDCTDPTHYHLCPVGCTDFAHYHDCPLGCTDPAHCHVEDCPVREFRAGMGCTLAGCTDPAHYHDCPLGCTDPAHYHDCPVGCQAHAHGYNSTVQRWGGHHGGHHGGGCHRW